MVKAAGAGFVLVGAHAFNAAEFASVTAHRGATALGIGDTPLWRFSVAPAWRRHFVGGTLCFFYSTRKGNINDVHNSGERITGSQGALLHGGLKLALKEQG